MSIITPEQKLRNVAAAVKHQATPTRNDTGKGRMPSYAAGKHTIASNALHLAELVIQYLDGELEADTDEVPF